MLLKKQVVLGYTGYVALNQTASTCTPTVGLHFFLEENKMAPNPHYINMLINVGIFALLVYVAINV